MSESPIDGYLDRLLPMLRGRPADIRRMLAETEDHLRQAASEAVAQGVDPEQAEGLAVERFGSPRLVARHFGRGPLGGLSGPAVRQAAAALAVLGVIGLVAIGISGGVAAGMGAVWGEAFVSGDLPGVTYTPARCAEFQEYFPHAATCEAAAIEHHYWEIVQYRVAAGVLGLTALAAAGLIHRRGKKRDKDGPTLRALPETFVPTAGTVLFGVAGAILGFDGLSLLSQGASHGAGGQLSGAIVSGAVALFFATRLFRGLGKGERLFTKPASPARAS